MLKCYIILFVVVLQICFSQVTEVPQSECDTEDKDFLSVKEETVSVLKLLTEENHSEDPDHLSVASSRGAYSKDVVSSSPNTGQKKEQDRVVRSTQGHGDGSLKTVVSTDRIHPSTSGKENNNNNVVGHKSNSNSESSSSKDVRKYVSDVDKSIGRKLTGNSKKLDANLKDNGQKLNQNIVDHKTKAATNSVRPQTTAEKKGASAGGQRSVNSKELVSNHKVVAQKLSQITADHTSHSKVIKTASPPTIRKESNIVSKSNAGPQRIISNNIPSNKGNGQKLNENKIIQNSSSKIVVNGVSSPNTVLKKEVSEVRNPPGEHLPSNSKQAVTLKSSSQSIEKNKLVHQKVKVTATSNNEINRKHDVSNISPSNKLENITVNTPKISDITKPLQGNTVPNNNMKSVSVEAKGSSDSTVASDTKQRLKRSVQQSDGSTPTERSSAVAKNSPVKVNESLISNVQQAKGSPPPGRSSNKVSKSVVKVNESLISNVQQAEGPPPPGNSYNKVSKSAVKVNESNTLNIQQGGGSPPTEKSYNKVSKPVVKLNESLISNVQQAEGPPPPGNSYNKVSKSAVKVNESNTLNIQQGGGSPPTQKSYSKVRKPVVKVNESLISNVQQAEGSPLPGRSYNKVSKSVVKVNESHTLNIQQVGGSPQTEKSYNVSKPVVKPDESLISNVQQAEGSPPPGKSYNKVRKSVVKVDASLTSNTKLSPDAHQRLKRSISDEAFDSSSVTEKPYSATEISSPSPGTSKHNSVPAILSTHSKKPEDEDKPHLVAKQELSYNTEGCETKESINKLSQVSRSKLSPPSSSAAKIDRDVPIIKEVCHADISSKAISSLDAHVSEKVISDKYENQDKLSDNDSKPFVENERNETKEKVEEIKIPDSKTTPKAQALQMEHSKEHDSKFVENERNETKEKVEEIKIPDSKTTPKAQALQMEHSKEHDSKFVENERKETIEKVEEIKLPDSKTAPNANALQMEHPTEHDSKLYVENETNETKEKVEEIKVPESKTAPNAQALQTEHSAKHDSKLLVENERNETVEKVEEIKVPDLKAAPNANALQMEHSTEHEVQSKITEKPNEGRIYDIKITSGQEDISDEKGDQQSKLQHENTMTSTVVNTEKYTEEQLLKPLRIQSETIKSLSGDENRLSNEDTKLERQKDNLSAQGIVESKLTVNDEGGNERKVETQQVRSHLQDVTETSVSDEPKAEALEQEGDLISWKQKRAHRNLPDESPTKSPSLEFPAVPEGDSFRIHELGLSEGLFVFSYLGSFLSWMQPYDFPVELLRDALWNRLSIVSLITQSLQVEMGFIACLCIGVLLALAAPFFLMIHACCSLVRRSQSSSTWEDDTASSSDKPGNCRRRTLVFLLQTILLLLVAGIVAMFVTNEQLSSAVQQTPKVVHTALGDVTTFLRNSNLQLNFVVTKSLDQAVETASADLDNIENLLGRPIQRELEAETGVDVALDALVDVTASAQTLSNKVSALHEYCGETRGLALVAQERLADLRHQVDMLRRQCPAKDRALCETVEGSGLDVVLQLDSVLNDQRLAGLRRLSQSNLSQVTQQARGEFQFIPKHVEKETRDARNGVRRQLLRQRSMLDDSVWSIEAITRDLGVRVEAARDRSQEIVRGASDMEQWRYLAGIGAAVSVLLVWVLLVGAISCGCCGAEDKARPTLLVTVGVLCPLYLALWALAMIALLVGGHGEVFVCRPLYDEPGYGALTKLMDKPGVLFQRGGGFFSSLLYGNDSLNVPLKDVLMACQQNRPSYPAFRLDQVFDVDSASDHRGWEALNRQLERLEVNLTDLQLLTPDLQRQLQELLNAASVNLTSHRVQLSGPVTGKDLLSFSDQLESVANQITDLATASRMETLATRTRRLLASHIAPLTQRKEDMVYQLTSLEVQLLPLQRQVNQSLSHLKTIQFFINNQGANISHIKSQEYISRIVGYLQQYRDHVLDATATHVAPCRPVWDLFHAMRVLFCRHVMDPLNGFWFATVWCLLLLLVAIPVCIKLAACYRQSRPCSLLPRSHTESPPAAANIPDPPESSRPWATPGENEQEGW